MRDIALSAENVARLTSEVKRSVLPLEEGRRFSNPMKKVNQLLMVMGYEVNMQFYRSRGLEDILQPYAHQDVMTEAFATLSDVCGTHAKCKKNINRVAVVMLALSQHQAWRACIGAGHDPHALARNIFACLRDNNGWQEAQDVIYNMACAWLRLGPDTLASLMLPSDPPWKWRCARQRIVASAMFGDHWWMFNAPAEGNLLDGDIVIAQRPDFMPGILDRVGAEPSMLLPAMEV
jgi:hypothetical protein